MPILSEIAWNRACDHFHDGTAQRTSHENVVAGHCEVATVLAVTQVVIFYFILRSFNDDGLEIPLNRSR